MSKRKKNMQPLVRFIFLVYLGFLLWLLFGRTSRWIEGESYKQLLRQNINLVPLLTIRNYMQVILHRTNEGVRSHCIINLVGNVVMFLPAGWLLPRIWQRYRNFFSFFFKFKLSFFLFFYWFVYMLVFCTREFSEFVLTNTK